MKMGIKIIFIDMSNTLVKGSGSNSGADFLGKGDIYRKLYSKYKAGVLSTPELLTEVFACWEGLDIKDLPKVYARFEFNDNVKSILEKIKARGIKTALITNIPILLSEEFRKDLGFNYISGTHLEVKEGKFTGRVLEFRNDKAEEVRKILEKEKISPSQAIAIGDTKEDAGMFKKVKFGIAYNGDETAKRAAKYCITDFMELLKIIEKE